MSVTEQWARSLAAGEQAGAPATPQGPDLPGQPPITRMYPGEVCQYLRGAVALLEGQPGPDIDYFLAVVGGAK